MDTSTLDILITIPRDYQLMGNSIQRLSYYEIRIQYASNIYTRIVDYQLTTYYIIIYIRRSD